MQVTTLGESSSTYLKYMRITSNFKTPFETKKATKQEKYRIRLQFLVVSYCSDIQIERNICYSIEISF